MNSRSPEQIPDQSPDQSPDNPPRLSDKSFEQIVDATTADSLKYSADMRPRDQLGITMTYPDQVSRRSRTHLIGAVVTGIVTGRPRLSVQSPNPTTSEYSRDNVISVLTLLAGHTETSNQLFSVIDRFHDPEIFQSIKTSEEDPTFYISKARTVLASNGIRIALSSDTETDSLIHNTISRLSGGPDSNQAVQMKKLIPFFETAAIKALQPGRDLEKTVADRGARWASAMEQGQLLRDEERQLSLLSSPKVLLIPRFAEMLTQRLALSTVEVSGKQERTNIHLAKMLFEGLLREYSTDTTRHQPNLALLTRLAFPNPGRPGAMSRHGLIKFANHITESKNRTASPQNKRALFNTEETGSLAPAIEIALGVTTANNASDETYRQHRLEDKLYANLIGLLLENRNHPQT